ncbi:CLUMA_CG012173, isoform B [Clunio marinus]|uniref:Phospholipase A2 n=1 Tax=Clunio marinus TaxID=568069 RepID=A0A1J1IIW5_9DIPT|nr:CLUMA_CG012173, isoform B [Clunio marinus]
MKYPSMNFGLIGVISLYVLCIESSIFVTDVKMNKMIELNARKPHCRLHLDRGTIQSTVLNTDPLKIRQVPVETIKTLERVCFEGNQLTREIQGTLWCGPGSIAKNYSDIGRHAEEDKCCRAHDHCYPQIAPGECLKSICNHGSFTRLHCDCDEKFRRCLSGLNTEPANTIGAAFFNAVQVTCFDYRRPCSTLQRVGYNETEQEEVCSRYKFRPSAKFRARVITYKTYT